jgi:hypothetical protein
MTDSERVVESTRKDSDLRRQVRRVNALLLLVLAALVGGPLFLTWWLERDIPTVGNVSIEEPRVLGRAELCYGDPLVYAYTFRAEGSGVLVRDAVIWRVTPPPMTVIYSTSQRLIITEPIDQDLSETWHVPHTFLNPDTDLEEELPPGNYRLIFAVSSTSRSAVLSIASVEFSILTDCGVEDDGFGRRIP